MTNQEIIRRAKLLCSDDDMVETVEQAEAAIAALVADGYYKSRAAALREANTGRATKSGLGFFAQDGGY